METIKKGLLEITKRNGFTSDIAKRLLEVYEKHGCPLAPGGPTTETKGFRRITTDSIGDGWLDPVEIVEEFNGAVDELFSCVGLSYIGSDIYLTSWNPGTEPWEEYKEEAREIIEEWLCFKAWDDFCSHN